MGKQSQRPEDGHGNVGVQGPQWGLISAPAPGGQRVIEDRANLSPGRQLGGQGVVPTGRLRAWFRRVGAALRLPDGVRLPGIWLTWVSPTLARAPVLSPCRNRAGHGIRHGQPSLAKPKLVSTTWT